MEQAIIMSAIRNYLEQCVALWPDQSVMRFLLEEGRDYPTGPETYAGPRAKAQACFTNATELALTKRGLTYVEGKIACHGVPIDHAWCIDTNGVVVDPTITDNHDGHVGEYFGVPFRLAYVMTAARINGFHGVLDMFYARRTLPKLLELGRIEGQTWLLDRTRLRNGALAALALAALLSPPAEAQTVYGRDGRVLSRSQTFSDGTTMTQDGRGRAWGTTTTSPVTGAVTVYGRDGRRAAEIVGRRP
jgi:hypothetical protein